MLFFFFQAEDGIRDADVTGVQTCALPICISETGVRTVETCVLVFGSDWPLSAPEPFLRADFPLNLPHINPHRQGELVSPCLFEGSMCRSEEHTSELQSRPHLVCRLLLEKKKINKKPHVV